MFRRSGVGCQQRRVAIAMHPKALLLGEITSAPDPELAVEVLNVVRDLAQDGDDVFGHARDAITPRSV